MDTSVLIDTSLIKKYEGTGPRYTSYPTIVQFNTEFSDIDYKSLALNTDISKPLSLYLHIPFCDTICFYCACNKIVTKNKVHSEIYSQYLYKEIEMQSHILNKGQPVVQMHWGGGTPTFLGQLGIRNLINVISENFNILKDDSGEYSIELDPRDTDLNTVVLLRKLGFNRLSIGVQDFDINVQKAINRLQSLDKTFEIINVAKHEGFKSISIDLIYGLPNQNLSSFNTTIDSVIMHNPSRIAIFNYAHLPYLFKSQRQINAALLPSPDLKLKILESAISKLTSAGYIYIGMDHFAKPDDELSLAQQAGSLYRNFQGYSTHAECNLLGIGITSISMFDNYYSQNVKKLDEYYARIKSGRLATFRGIKLTKDDLLRRDIINSLVCNFKLDFCIIEKLHNINFTEYFSEELETLNSMKSDGLISINKNNIRVLPVGRLLIRNICMVFDKYLNFKNTTHFSLVI